MSKNKYTPGPWNLANAALFTTDGVARLEFDGAQDDTEAQNNAILAEAAPDLLAACEAALGGCRNGLKDLTVLMGNAEYHDQFKEACRLSTKIYRIESQIRAAIAKSKG